MSLLSAERHLKILDREQRCRVSRPSPAPSPRTTNRSENWVPVRNGSSASRVEAVNPESPGTVESAGCCADNAAGISEMKSGKTARRMRLYKL